MSGVPQPAAQQQLEAAEAIAIAQLSPALQDPKARVVRGVVTITWPYSIVRKNIAFLLAEADFRLRRAKGQVRVEFAGSTAKAIADAALGSGDEIALSLDGVELVADDSKTRVPGTSLEWQLRFTERVLLQAKISDSEEVKVIDVDHPAQPESEPEELPVSILESFQDVEETPGPIATPAKTPLSKRPADHGLGADEFASPAFLKRARVSYGSLFDGGLDIFDEADDGAKARAKKKPKTGRYSSVWTYASRTPSLEPEAPEEEDTSMVVEEQPTVATPSRPTMVDGACQTVEQETSPPRDVQVAAEARQDPSYWQTPSKSTMIDSGVQSDLPLSPNIGLTPLGFGPPPPMPIFTSAHEQYPPAFQQPPIDPVFGHDMEPHYGAEGPFHEHPSAYPEAGLDHSPMHGHYPTTFLDEPHFGPDGVVTSQPLSEPIPAYQDHPQQHDLEAQPHHTVMVDGVAEPQQIPWGLTSAHYSRSPAKPAESGEVHEGRASSPQDADGETWEEDREREARDDPEDEEALRVEEDQMSEDQDGPEENFASRTYAERRHERGEEAASIEKESSPVGSGSGSGSESSGESDEEAEHEADDTGGDYDITHFRNLSNNQDDDAGTDLESDYGQEEEEEILDPEDDEEAEESEDYDEEGYDEGDYDEDEDQENQPPPAAPRGGPPVVIDLLSDSEDEDEAPPPPPPPAAAPRRQIPQYDGSADEMEDGDMDDQESQGESVRNEDSQQGSSPQPSDAESEEDQASQVGTPTPKPRQAAVFSAPDLTTGSIGDDFETMSPVKLPHMAGVPHSSSRPTSRGESDDLEAELERELEEEIAADDAGSDRQTPAPSEGMAGVEETGIVPSSPFNEDVRHAPPKQAASSPFNEGPAGDTALKQAVSSPVRTDVEDSEVLGEETLAVESPVAEESSPVRVVSAAEEEAGVRSMAEESSPVRSVAKEPAVKSMAEESSPVRPVPAVEEELAVESPVAESSPVRPVAATKKKPAVKSMAEESSPVRPVPAIGEESSPVRPVTATKKEAAVKFPMAEESSPVRPVPVVEEESSPVRPVSAAKEGPAVESLVAEVSSPVRAVGAVEESPEPETEAADVQVAPEEEDDVEPEELVTDEAEGQSLADQSEALVTESLQARIDDAAETEVAQAEDETVQPEVPAEDVTRQTPELEASNVEAPGQTEEVQRVDPDDKVAAKEQSPEHTEVTVAEVVEETVSVDATAHTSPKEATPDHVEIKETEVTKMEVEETQPQSDDEDMEVSLIPDETIVQDVEEATVEVQMDSDDEGSVEPADVDMGDPDDMSVDDEVSSNAADSDMELDDVTQDQLIQSQLYEESMMYEEDQTVTTSITTTQMVEERPVSQGGDAADDAHPETEVVETSRVTVETTITEPLETTDAQQAQVEDAMDVDELEDAKSTQMASPTPTPQSFEETTAETETSQADEQLTPRATQTVESFTQSFFETQATEVTVPDDGEPQAEQLAEPLDEKRPAESPAAAPVQPHEPLLDDEEEVEREKEASTHHEADADAPSPINDESSQIRDSSAQPSEAQSSLIAEDTSEEVVSAAKPTPKRGRGQHHRTNSKDQDPSVKLARASIASRRSTRLSDRTTPDIHSSAAAAPVRGTAATATTTSRGRSASLALKSDSPDADAEDTEVQPARAAVKSPSRAPKTAKESVTKGGKETVPKEAKTKESKAKEKETPKESGVVSSSTAPTEQSSAALKAQLTKSLRADVPDCISLKVLRSHPGRTVDVLAVATTNPPEAKRAKGGPRGIMLAFNVTDHSIAPAQTVAVQIFRPHKAALPVIHQGDAVLLRNFSVMVLTRSGFGLRANDGSSWAVFETRRHGHGGEGQGGGDGSSADADAGDDLPQIRGPPVELSEGETGYAALLRRWYAGLDAKSLARLDKANEAAPAVGNVGKEGK